MPDPIRLGNTARAIVQTVRDMEEQDLADCFALTAAAGKGDTDSVLMIAERIAARNLGTFKALTFLDADHYDRAQNALIDAKRMRQR